MPNYTKTCSFLHAHYTETLKVVETFVKKTVYGEKHSFIERTYVVGAHWMNVFLYKPKMIFYYGDGCLWLY